MKLLLCQTPSTLGDFERNQKKILSLAQKHSHCDLLIFPELFMMGYPPEDLLELKFFIQKQEKWVQKLQSQKIKPALLFGSCSLEKDNLYNSAIYLHNKKIHKIHKRKLAVTDTFDEMRFFTPDLRPQQTLKIKGRNILVLICEDLWKIQFKNYSFKNLDAIICINASPFFPEQLHSRKKHAQSLCKKLKAPLIYVNQVGGQDEWVFDGSSFVLNSKGETVFQAPSFKEGFAEINLKKLNKKIPSRKPHLISLKKDALVLGLRDYIKNNHFQKVHLGLSGGIDSALTVLLCKEALQNSSIKAFYLEGPFSSSESKKLSRDLALEQKIEWESFSITKTYKHFFQVFEKLSDIAQQNIQARLRNLFLMTYSNNQTSLLIGTSNKSELATGYSTLYGDCAGGLLPLGDLYKTEIYEMAKLFPSSVIKKILKRKPSAELSPSQTDEKDLFPYSVLDPILKNIIEKQKKPQTKIEKEIFSRLLKFEFKRRQSPIVFKVSFKSFGRGRRYPITLYR